MLKLNKYDTSFERNMMFILRVIHFEILIVSRGMTIILK